MKSDYRFLKLKQILLLLFVCLVFYSQASCQADPVEKILVALSNPSQTDATIYTINTDGSGKSAIFDFKVHPVQKNGGIFHLRIGKDNRSIYFSSDNTNLYTPAGRNIFRIASDGSWWDQITPGPNSGHWNQGCPCGIIEGKVLKSGGGAWVSAPVYIEGLELLYTGTDGSFLAENVPSGRRYVVAYRPGTIIFDAQEVFVTPSATTTLQLIPDTDYRTNFQNPVEYDDRIYFLQGLNSIEYTDLGAQAYQEVYLTPPCVGIANIDGFDVGRQTGRLAVLDYQEGCYTNQGLYIADKDGNNKVLFLDMKKDPNWCGVQDVFWSPDEKMLALKGCYGWYTYLLVYDAMSGRALGSIYFKDQKYTLYNVTLHGWSPGGEWLLYSHYLNQPAEGVLSKIKVNTNGSIDPNSIQDVLQNVTICGATWGLLGTPTLVTERMDQTPGFFEILQNYPNPFNPSTILPFGLSTPCHVQLDVYNAQGRYVDRILDEEKPAGWHEAYYQAENLAGGIYFFKLRAGGEIKVVKALLLK
ncbi:T9SS type A sorting domain-containing protein [candidate division KSB1 bacterium]|nr:T9SS type A sorting domain-containing protein [candidate division KSB1 bacterium]